MDFNPAAYVLTARETLDRMEARDRFLEENAHLSVKFPVDGLEHLLPPVQMGEVAVFGAGSHHGKSLFLKHWVFRAQKTLEESGRRAQIAYISHEDTGEMIAQQQVEKYEGNKFQFEDDLFTYIGRSFGMRPEDVAELYMTNIIRALQFAKESKFAEPMPFAMLAYDFLQKTPPDPERRKMTTDAQRRLQLADDSARLGNAAVYFSCPVVVAAQTGLKKLNTPYSAGSKDQAAMLIPGDGDFEEAKEIYQYADHAYTGWLPFKDYPVGKFIENGNWNFQVTKDLFFLRHLKSRYCNPNKWKGIGRVFPLRIQQDGSFVYDPEFHKKIYTTPPQEVK